MAIAAKLRDDEVVVIDELSFAEPKTKEMAGILKALQCGGQSLLIASAQHDPTLYKAARNIRDVTVTREADLNALLVLGSRRMLVTRAALDAIKTRAASKGSA